MHLVDDLFLGGLRSHTGLLVSGGKSLGKPFHVSMTTHDKTVESSGVCAA